MLQLTLPILGQLRQWFGGAWRRRNGGSSSSYSMMMMSSSGLDVLSRHVQRGGGKGGIRHIGLDGGSLADLGLDFFKVGNWWCRFRYHGDDDVALTVPPPLLYYF
jgi:hypothetical protein